MALVGPIFFDTGLKWALEWNIENNEIQLITNELMTLLMIV